MGRGRCSGACAVWLAGVFLLLLPGWHRPASAQVFRCVDAGSGQVLYTDRSCHGGALVVPERSAEQARVDADRARDARERELQRRETVLQLQQDRLRREQEKLARAQAEQAAADSACRDARAAAAEQAARSGVSAEEMRIARDNAALACGQPPPSEETIRVVRQVVPAWTLRRPRARHYHRHPPRYRPPRGPQRPHPPHRPWPPF